MICMRVDKILLIMTREGHGAMFRAWRSGDVAACRVVSNPAWCRIFREISCFSPLNLGTLLRMLCPWARHFTLKCFTWLRWEWVPGRTEMAMCTISSMRRNGCRTVCSPWSWNGTRMNRSSDQGVRCRMIGLQTWYHTMNLHLYLFYFTTIATF